ncbi:NUDIX domain-containing protein [Ectobacillus antri]|jgi:8-oxo-dGTP diphosphatase|uniref:NUDIX domain-containing protein n=1 Tax=Ectobacillus antri TaxID=2486280 RepID=A0ABT6H4F6_9BACI|nr:NUDIX domain-containing protein [Ectobacillus antri]MDG4656857.1 NUDIX domain-containing protein [Ectobacillus antri]MDG5754246.1 NUDIX domain-containing protein [Ectobacillus antri]
MKIRNSAKAIIIKDNHLLVIQKRDTDGDFYLLIGGGQEFGETLHEAVQRECIEEAGIEVKPGDLLFVREYIGKFHEHAAFDSHLHQMEFMFWCEALTEPNKQRASQLDEGQIDVVWLPLADIEKYRFYPQELRASLRQRFLNEDAGRVYLGSIN